MKTICVLFIVGFTLYGLEGNAQTRITFSNKNASMQDVFKAIEKQTGYTFVIDKTLLPKTKRVPVDVINGSVQDVLDQYFKDQPLFTYSIIENLVVIQEKGGVHINNTPPLPVTNINGKVINETGEPIAGVSVIVKGNGSKAAITNDSGEFRLNNVLVNATLVVSSINYERQDLVVTGRQDALIIQLKKQVGELADVVVVSNGYKKEDKREATGSYAKVSNQLLNRSVSTNVVDRLEGVTSGVLFIKNIQQGLNQSAISVRGRSTIYANPNPLIILDNFPYTGDINNINPNDVESISVLKDAAATAIWGVLSGNGVIVITTKTGKYNQPLKVSVNSNITFGAKLDLYYQPILSSADYVEVEKYLFKNDFYQIKEVNPLHPVLPPVVEILIKKRDGIISMEDADRLLNNLRNQDVRKDLDKYFYRKSINQQYAANVSGGGPNYQYYISAGYDRNLANQVGNEYYRKTFTANNTLQLVDKKLEFNAGVIFTESNTKENDVATLTARYPYLRLADEYGNALSIPADLRQLYKDTAHAPLNWDLKPLDELHLQDNTRHLTDYRINLGLKYSIFEGLEANVLYQYNKGFSRNENYRSQETYFTRNLINKFTQVSSNGALINNVPLGGIFDRGTNDYEANNYRIQLSYNRVWNKLHSITAISGAEVRSFVTQSNLNRLFGYKPELQSGDIPSYQTDYPLFYAPFITSRIQKVDGSVGTTDHYLSYFINVTYSYKNTYSFSASARKDESNIFGVKANQKGVPLWSAGIGWTVSRENFYSVNWLPYLKVRATGGYNGNVDKTVSAYTTANTDGFNVWNTIFGSITNPPNPSLSWEKIYMINLGVDFATKNRIVEGSLEYFTRNGKDIIGYSQLDPTTGNTIFRGNTANMKGSGFDITLNIKNLNSKLKWNSTLLISGVTDKVTAYKVKQSTIENYLTLNTITPIEGNPLYSVYSLKWMGLDSQNGDPQGYYDNKISKDYTAIFGSSNLDDLHYQGPANPTLFGSFRNTFSWKQLELSFNIIWKAGYYFRRNSIDYNSLFNGGVGHSDFDIRWQNPGDEQSTNVPSLKYPIDVSRDRFYAYSDVLVEKGDHIRLQDLQLSYDFAKKNISGLPLQLIRLYIYANNLGILWKANDKGIDPDFISGIPNPRTISIGIKADF